MKNLPARKEQFSMRLERIAGYFRKRILIPPIITMEMRMLLESYYGGRWALIRHLIAWAVREAMTNYISAIIWWFSDLMRWTKVEKVPETKDYAAHGRRHGSSCHGSPNCSQDCIDRDQPAWFRKFIDWYINK